MTSQGQRFRRRALRRGYKVDEVDTFLDRAEATLAGAPGVSPVTAQEVHDVVFRVRFGGYDEWQVDLHLDRVERQLAELEERGPGYPRGPEGRRPLPLERGPDRAGPPDRMPPMAPERGGPMDPMGAPMGPPDRMGPPPMGPPGRMQPPPDRMPPPGRGNPGMVPTERMQPVPDRMPPPGRAAPPDRMGPPPMGPPDRTGHPDRVGHHGRDGHPERMGPPSREERAVPPPGMGRVPVPPAPAGPPPGRDPGGFKRYEEQPPPGGRAYGGESYGGFEPGRHGKADMTTEIRMMGDASPAGPPMSPEMQRIDLLRRSFQARRFGSGYDRDQVDRLFDGVISAMGSRGPVPITDTELDPGQFSLVPGGYFEAEVDAALKEVRDILRRR